jgi:uncharacterized protein YdhG (YjbR/CyaY superfamily)
MTVDDYIATAPAEAQPVLRKVRALAQKTCPDAEEVISYRIPALKQGKVFFYYAAFKNHLGIYPPVRAPQSLVQKLKPFAGPNGNLQFPYSKPIPYDLIGTIIHALQTINVADP